MLKRLKPNKNLRASLDPIFTPQKQKNTQNFSFFQVKKKDLGNSLGALTVYGSLNSSPILFCLYSLPRWSLRCCIQAFKLRRLSGPGSCQLFLDKRKIYLPPRKSKKHGVRFSSLLDFGKLALDFSPKTNMSPEKWMVGRWLISFCNGPFFWRHLDFQGGMIMTHDWIVEAYFG